MNEFVYMLRVAENEALLASLAKALTLKEFPHYVRVATLAPLSTFGYLAGMEAAILSWTDAGLSIGLPEDVSVPRAFIPWQNISYVAEGDLMKEFQDFRSLPENADVPFEEFRRRLEA